MNFWGCPQFLIYVISNPAYNRIHVLETDLVKKRDILLETLKDKVLQINSNDCKSGPLFNLLALHECGESAISVLKELKSIIIDSQLLWMSDIFALMSVAKKSGKLGTLALPGSGLCQSHVKVMCDITHLAGFRVGIMKEVVTISYLN